MAIKSELSTKPIGWLTRNFAEKRLKTEISIQRREVWDVNRKSNLIVSLLIGIPIENLLFEESASDSNTLLVIDGKQRILTICSYIEDGFPLTKNIRRKFIDGEDIRELKFSELSENLQNKILEQNFSATTMRPLSDDERSLVFFMRNQAVPLTNMEISRASIGEEGMEVLTELAQHPFMDKVKITVPARRKYQDMQIFTEFLMLKTLGVDTGFTAFEISAFCEHIHDNPTLLNEEFSDSMKGIMDYLDKAFDKKRPYLKKANLPMVLCVAEEAMGKIDPSAFAEWSDALFETLSKDEEYTKLCKSYKRSEVQGRMTRITDSAKKKLFTKK